MSFPEYVLRSGPWNKGKLVGQKAPLKQEQICNLVIELSH